MKLNFSLACINVRSLTRNFVAFKDATFDKFDIIAVDESWLNSSILDSSIGLRGYSLIRSDRPHRGGGIAAYFRNGIFKFSLISRTSNQSEQMWVQVEYQNFKFALCVFYRPQNFSMNIFLEELESNLSRIAVLYDFVIVCGDFNEDYLNPNHSVNELNRILDSFSLKQIIDKPTRYTETSERLLDYIICSEEIQVSNVFVSLTPVAADHSLTAFNAQIDQPDEFQPYEFSYRNYDQVGKIIAQEFSSVPFDNILHERNINLKVGLFNQYLIKLFNKIAPFKTIKVTKPKVSWLNDSIKKLQKERNKWFRKFKRTKATSDWEKYCALRNEVNIRIRKAKKSAIESQLSRNNPKQVWQTLRKLGVVQDKKDRSTINTLSAESLNNHFIASTTNKKLASPELITFYDTTSLNENVFQFQMTDEEEVFASIFKVKSTSKGADQISGRMIIEALPFILPYLVHIFNSCIEQSVYPCLWKISHITPIPKINNPKSLSDCRTISTY